MADIYIIILITMSLDELLKQRGSLENAISGCNRQRAAIANALTANKDKKEQLEKDFMVYLQEFEAVNKNKKTITNDEFFRKFKINVKYGWEKLIPWKRELNSSTKSWTRTVSKWPKELINNKIQLFFNILFEHWISPEDISEITEIEWNNSPYYLINIEKINKSIFINQSYWEATFVYDSSFFPRQEQLQKSDIKEKCTQINYNEKKEATVENWEKRILKSLWIN